MPAPRSRCLAAAALVVNALLSLRAVGAVKELVTYKEFKGLLAEAGARPVIIDYYSQSCGPCHMIAPVYRKIAKEFAGRAYFRKLDVNRNSQTAQSQGVRSMPTFQFWVKGKKVHQFSGPDEFALREWTKKLIDQADREDIEVTREALEAFYKKHDPSKADAASISKILEKNSKDFVTMVRLLKKKYGEAPATRPRVRKAAPKRPAAKKGAAAAGAPVSLAKIPLEELKREVERREEDAALEKQEEEERRLANNPCSLYRSRTEGAIEKVVIIGGGPAGMTAAIYAARANLCPLMIAPALGGQLMAKGVDVENYPGMPRFHGGKMIEIMKHQARSFFTEVRDDVVLEVDTESRPFVLRTNTSGTIKAQTIIIATGADSKWLGTDGEYEYRGHGVSSCAACDGYLFKGRPCVVVGGGDTAMEEALMLSRICSRVDLVHRRSEFRASLVMQQRVLTNPAITVRWNSEIRKFVGSTQVIDGEERKALTHVELRNTSAGAAKDAPPTVLNVDAAFVAIGHDPNTGLLRGKVTMDESSYVVTSAGSTRTSVPGIFAAGDVADHVYRQAVTSAGSGAMAALDAERYLSEQPLDASEDASCVRQEDFSGWSLPELKKHAELMGIKCTSCKEKTDFIASLRASY